ncbi:MAG: hypothetical protein NZM25_04760 [Leptospiraceae bacterium]|nr:hypothetical protein [Leptospiraceae bacterium]MDW8305679.1 Na+/H+ antiporter NhaC family protein [Leptospiraceae bacterium]
MTRKIFFVLLSFNALLFWGIGLTREVGRENPSLFSLLPAGFALFLTFLRFHPLFSLGYALLLAFLLQIRNLTPLFSSLPKLFEEQIALVVLLYIILLGSLSGLWQSFGIAHAFGNYLGQKFIRSTISAKVVSYALGLLFFQGGTLSAVLTGTTVRPLADKVRVSHEELSYVVDSTSSPVALLVPLNAWPYYIQSLLVIPTIPYFASLEDRLLFFYRAIPYFFYAILALVFTLVLVFDGFWLAGKRMQEAARRSRTLGLLDSPSAKPLQIPLPLIENVGKTFDYPANLCVLFVVVLAGFFLTGQPFVILGFSASLLFTLFLLLGRTRPRSLAKALIQGIRGNSKAGFILIMAILLGKLTAQLGSAEFLLKHIPENFPLVFLPMGLFLTAAIVSLATGTSWGTFAILLPAALPLVYSLALPKARDIESFFLLSFAAILNGSLFGDHTSPVSDTTILSSLATGADLNDHVRTQWTSAMRAAFLSLVLYTAFAWYFVY